MQKLKELLIFSQRVAERMEPEEFSGMISIRGPNMQVALQDGWEPLLILEFNDIVRPFSNFVAFNERHAHAIISWLDSNLSSLDTLMIHCEQGVSRSKAVGMFVQEYYASHLPKLKNADRYNTLVYSTLKRCMNKEV